VVVAVAQAAWKSALRRAREACSGMLCEVVAA